MEPKNQKQFKTYSDGRGGVYTLPIDDVLTPPATEKTFTALRRVDTEEVTLELEDHLFINLALSAHELDVTLNEYINILLHDALKDEVELSEKETMLFNMDK